MHDACPVGRTQRDVFCDAAVLCLHLYVVSYPEAEDFGASCFFGCAWVLKNCPGLTEASAGRDLRSTGLF